MTRQGDSQPLAGLELGLEVPLQAPWPARQHGRGLVDGERERARVGERLVLVLHHLAVEAVRRRRHNAREDMARNAHILLPRNCRSTSCRRQEGSRGRSHTV